MTFGLFSPKAQDCVGQNPRGDRRQRSQSDDSARLGRNVARAVERCVEILKRPFERGNEIARDPGQFDRARVAVEQRDAERLLETPDLHGEGRLGDVQDRRRAGEALDASDRQEGTDLPQADIHKVMLLLISNKFNCLIMPFAA